MLDAIRYSREAWFTGWSTIGGTAPRAEQAATAAVSRLHRWILDPATGKVTEQSLDDGAAEFPTVDDRRVGLPNRFLYAVAQSAIIKFDSERGSGGTARARRELARR